MGCLEVGCLYLWIRVSICEKSLSSLCLQIHDNLLFFASCSPHSLEHETSEPGKSREVGCRRLVYAPFAEQKRAHVPSALPVKDIAHSGICDWWRRGGWEVVPGL